MDQQPPKGITPEQRRKLIMMVVITDLIVFGLVAYFLVVKPRQGGAPAPSPSAPVASPR